jgi:hypothetical protein
MATTTTKRVSGTASGGQTPRVSGTPAGGATSAIHHLLLLEGDMQDNGDYLLLEGDMQSGDDVLKLEGDEATVGSTITKRVPEPVA